MMTKMVKLKKPSMKKISMKTKKPLKNLSLMAMMLL